MEKGEGGGGGGGVALLRAPGLGKGISDLNRTGEPDEFALYSLGV